jgi:hypothetical protein
VPKEGAGTSGQKGLGIYGGLRHHRLVVLSPSAWKILDRKQTKIQELSSAHHKRTVAETAYPFTLDWNDWNNNLVGLSNQRPTINHRLSLGKSSFVRL